MTSEPIPRVFSDRRVWLFVLSIFAAVLVGFVVVPDDWALKLVSHAGYWFVLAAFGIWVWSLGRIFVPELRRLNWRSVDWVSAGLIAVGGVVLTAHESFGFKIIMDELMLLGTSMSMHLDKTVLTPLRGNDIQGAFMIVEGIVDKRPLFYPFLVSVVHDISGYRPENSFVVNGTLTFLFLWLVYMAGRLLAGRTAGWLGVLLFTGLPLLAQNSTGGGFELLNLTMILGTILLGAVYVQRRDAVSLVAFGFAAILLAQVRYESVIYMVPVAVLILWVWRKIGRITLPWPIIAAPLLMVHYPLQHRIFDIRASAWEMASKPGYTKPFSLSYVPENLSHALQFFFAPASDQPNSIVLSLLGVLAVPFFLLLLMKRVRSLADQSPAFISIAVFSLGFALQFGLMMCYFWGKFDDPVIRRLSLPTQLAMVLALLAILPQFTRPVMMRALLACATIGLLARSVPSMAAHAYSQEYLPGRETAWRREFMATQARPDYLMIDNDATLWVAHRVSATPTTSAVKRRVDIAFHFRNRTFSNIYVFQRFNIDADTGARTLWAGDDLGPEFVLEPVTEERLQLLTLSRISRVVEIRDPKDAPAAPDGAPGTGSAAQVKNRAEIEKARQAFMENYMKKLP